MTPTSTAAPSPARSPAAPGRVSLLLALPAVLVGVAFFAWPMVSILWTGLAREPGSVGGVLTSRAATQAVWFTTWQAAVSTALTLAVGLPITHALTRFRFRGRAIVRTVVTIPFVLPTVVVAIAFLGLVGPSGALGVDLSGTIWIILAAHVFFNLAVVVRTVGGLWGHLDPSLEAAAASLGASRWRIFRTVTLPLLRPAIVAAGAIVFLFSFTSFGIVLLLGAPMLATIEVEIYRAAALVGDLPAAAVLALVQIVGVSAGLFLYARYQETSGTAQQLLPTAATGRRPHTRGEKWFVGVAVGAALTIALGPMIAIAARAVTIGGGPGLVAVRALTSIDRSIVDVPGSIVNSVEFAVFTALLAVALALPVAVVVAARGRGAGRWIDTLLMLPLGSSAVTLGLGFIVALDSPVDLRAWWGLVPIAHTLVAMPFVVRATVPVIRSIEPRLREAAAVMGAAPGRVWRTVDLPIMSPAGAGAAALAFVISLGEFGATLFVARPGGRTMTLAIFRLFNQPGTASLAAALGLSVILMVLTAAAVSSLERLRMPGIGSF